MSDGRWWDSYVLQLSRELPLGREMVNSRNIIRFSCGLDNFAWM